MLICLLYVVQDVSGISYQDHITWLLCFYLARIRASVSVTEHGMQSLITTAGLLRCTTYKANLFISCLKKIRFYKRGRVSIRSLKCSAASSYKRICIPAC